MCPVITTVTLHSSMDVFLAIEVDRRRGGDVSRFQIDDVPLRSQRRLHGWRSRDTFSDAKYWSRSRRGYVFGIGRTEHYYHYQPPENILRRFFSYFARGKFEYRKTFIQIYICLRYYVKYFETWSELVHFRLYFWNDRKHFFKLVKCSLTLNL